MYFVHINMGYQGKFASYNNINFLSALTPVMAALQKLLDKLISNFMCIITSHWCIFEMSIFKTVILIELPTADNNACSSDLMTIVCNRYYYRPQRSCGKVMFSQASVILFTGGLDPPGRHPCQADTPARQTPLPGRHPCQADTPLGTHPLARHPPGQTHPGRQPQPNFLHFHAVFEIIWQNNRFAPPYPPCFQVGTAPGKS